MLRLTKSVAVLLPVLLMAACVLAPGMRVGDLPSSGSKISENGLNIQVDQITATSLPTQTSRKVSSDVLSLFARKTYPTYLLASGDVLGINLWANPEITPPTTSSAAGIVAGFVVDQDGYISFPLIGSIKAEGETLAGFSEKLQKHLGSYLKQPDAQVKVLLYQGRKFNIDGQVKAPGQYALSNQVMTLYGALASAGGMLETGDIDNILLTRGRENYHIDLLELQRNHLSPNDLFLKEGDSLHVYSKESRKLYLLGESGIPGALILPEQGMSLANVIGEGRGLGPLSANPSKVYVVRDDSQLKVVHIYHVDISSIANLALAERFKMQQNDIVYIDASGLARWSRVLNLLLPSAQGLASLSTTEYYSKIQ